MISVHLYRERGALIEAMQLTGVPPDGTNVEDVFAWMHEGNTPGKGLPVERTEKEQARRAVMADLALKYLDRPPSDAELDLLLVNFREDVEMSPKGYIDADDDLVVVIHSPDQTWTGRVGDWVVKHRNREFSVIGDDEFEAMYEVVE